MYRFWIAAVFTCLIACSSDKEVGDGLLDGDISSMDTCEPGNMPPYVVITSHEDGAIIPSGETDTFKALLGDPDDELSELTANWYIDGVLACEDAPIDTDGQTTCDIEVSGSSSVIRVDVTDPDGYTDEDVVVVQESFELELHA